MGFSSLRKTKALSRGARTHIIILAAFLLFAAPLLQAQVNLNFKRVTANWPTIELYFSVGCNGMPSYNMTEQDFRIFENGFEVEDFTLYCPDPAVRCPASVALVLDASGSMMGAGNTGAKNAGHAFIDLMDGAVDEAAIIFFTHVVTVQQTMTFDAERLHSAVDDLPANGATAVWDGTFAGVQEVINRGNNPCRAVIAMTDGGDNSSTVTVAEIISLANRNNIRVFTVGFGNSVNATELEQIALLTGGRYYQTPNAAQLTVIYQEISQIISEEFQECRITYQNDCADGMVKKVDLHLENFCGGYDM